MYHINGHGEAAQCRAEKGHCPFGYEESHFTTKEAARQHYENFQEKSTVALVSHGATARAYHGSTAKFDEFSYEHLGNTGSEHGWGFYFSDDEDSVRSYADNGYIYAIDFHPQKAIILGQKKVKRDDVRNLLLHAEKENNFLSDNWGDVEYEGLTKVLNTAINAYSEGEDDVAIITNILNDTGEYRHTYEYLHEKYGYDSIETNLEKGWKHAHIYVATHPSAFDVAEVRKISQD